MNFITVLGKLGVKVKNCRTDLGYQFYQKLMQSNESNCFANVNQKLFYFFSNITTTLLFLLQFPFTNHLLPIFQDSPINNISQPFSHFYTTCIPPLLCFSYLAVTPVISSSLSSSFRYFAVLGKKKLLPRSLRLPRSIITIGSSIRI